MMLRTWIGCALVAVGVAVAVGSLTARQSSGDGDLAGVVRSSAGSEAGVWVIAETDDLDTRFRKIVVTDDDGRFLVPDLPAGLTLPADAASGCAVKASTAAGPATATARSVAGDSPVTDTSNG